MLSLPFLLASQLAISAYAAPSPSSVGGTSLSNKDSSLTILYQNNLNGSDDANHISAILLDATSPRQAAAACASLGETLLSRAAIQAHSDDFYNQLSYLVYNRRANRRQQYQISDGLVSFDSRKGRLDFQGAPRGYASFPVLCTQSTSSSQPTNSSATAANEITIAAAGNTYLGYRNKKSWRFSGLRYANIPARWQYSSVYSGVGQSLNATAFGSQCVQVSGQGSEDCLFLNVQTPYIPKPGSKKNLKPVLFWIHGGGFNGGTGSDPGSDGGNPASREDVVVVTINYRLATLGFFNVPGTNITGNYGIADQITALQWTINNIAAFGGDANQIVIAGSSAGGGSVRVLLGSPPAIGKFQGGIAQSNLGGGVGLGQTGNYATAYSSYITPQQGYALAGQQIFTAVGCNQTSVTAQIACLAQVNYTRIATLPTRAEKVVQDGKIVNTEQLIVNTKNASTAHVPVIFGINANDGSSFSTYPKKANVTSELQGIELSLGITEPYAQGIIDSGLFPYYDSGNLTLDSFNVSQRVATDNQFRCVDEATVYAGATTGAFPRAYYYESDRTLGGYDPNGLGGPPVTPGYPRGNPNLPYFRVHGADQGWLFGNLPYLRDGPDLYSLQLESNWYAGFMKRGDPNQPRAYLEARGYTRTIEGIQLSGSWDPIVGANGPIKHLDWPSYSAGFVDVPQCAYLNYSLSYYLEGGI
nr:hypothetical protein B0A51_02006 [Rachicladosporium sp. CCFEE 5018]